MGDCVIAGFVRDYKTQVRERDWGIALETVRRLWHSLAICLSNLDVSIFTSQKIGKKLASQRVRRNTPRPYGESCFFSPHSLALSLVAMHDAMPCTNLLKSAFYHVRNAAAPPPSFLPVEEWSRASEKKNSSLKSPLFYFSLRR